MEKPSPNEQSKQPKTDAEIHEQVGRIASALITRAQGLEGVKNGEYTWTDGQTTKLELIGDDSDQMLTAQTRETTRGMFGRKKLNTRRSTARITESSAEDGGASVRLEHDSDTPRDFESLDTSLNYTNVETTPDDVAGLPGRSTNYNAMPIMDKQDTISAAADSLGHIRGVIAKTEIERSQEREKAA